MALSLERVRVADIRPLEDEYGNQFASRDYTLEVNREYVRELAGRFGPDGEPEEPVRLVRDGDVYRIKTGNSRVRAMELLGTEECWALVDDAETVKGVLEAVVRTDAKKKYEEVELSRYVQQLSMFGDDEYLGEVAGISPERARRVRRGAAIAGERAAQFTMEWLEAAAEFDGDDEAVERILESPESGWRGVADELRRERDRREAMAAFRAEADRMGVPVFEEMPPGLSYAGSAYDPGDFEEKCAEACAGHAGVVCRLSSGWSGVHVSFYGEPVDGGAEDAESAEARRRIDEAEEAASRLDDEMLAWAVTRFEEGEPMPSLREACSEAFRSQYYVEAAANTFPAARGSALSDIDFAIGYRAIRKKLTDFAYAIADPGERAKWQVGRIRAALDWIDLHVQDGWQPDEGMSALLDEATAALVSLEGDAE